MRAKWSFIADKKAGEMTNAIITECERLGRAFTIALTLLGSLVVAVIYVVLSTVIAWQVTVSLIGFALVAALAMGRLYRRSYAVGASVAPLNAELQATLSEQFAGAKFIKASAGGDRAATLIEPILRKLERANADASAMPGTVRNVLEFIGLIGLAIILVLAGQGMGVAVGNVVIVIALFGRLFPRLTAVQSQLYSLNANVHAIEAIDKLQIAAETEAERHDGSNEALHIDQPTALVVRNLQVKFGERAVLDQVNLTLPIPGLLAIVGRSGAGKSTLVHALLGLVESSTDRSNWDVTNSLRRRLRHGAGPLVMCLRKQSYFMRRSARTSRCSILRHRKTKSDWRYSALTPTSSSRLAPKVSAQSSAIRA